MRGHILVLDLTELDPRSFSRLKHPFNSMLKNESIVLLVNTDVISELDITEKYVNMEIISENDFLSTYEYTFQNKEILLSGPSFLNLVQSKVNQIIRDLC